MKRLFFFISFVLLFFFITFSQQRQPMEEFYHHEWNTFKEFVRLSADHIPDTNIDVGFYYLDLYIAIDSPYIEGTVTCRFEAVESGVDQVCLSLNSALSVDAVSGNTTGFSRSGDSILIILDDIYGPGDTAGLLISYHGVPALAGGYKGLRYETHHNNEPIIATLSTPYLAHYWYPCKDGPSDKPDSVYVDITIPVKLVNGKELIAVSNGLLGNVIDHTTSKTYQWRHRYPVVPYYVMVAISNFVHFGETYTGIYGEEYPLDYYVFQQDLAVSQAGVVDMPQALDIFSEKFGEYPFSDEKYGMTQLGFYGAIENQTNTITNNMSLSWFNVSVHELGHMWFGDMITCKSWNHAWLNEGFASYSEAIYQEEVNGFGAYQAYMSSFQYWNGGSLYLQNANDTFGIFQGIIYSKGAYVLHMLRGVLGDSIFNDCVYAYATDPDLMYGQAVTEDLQQVCEDISGLDLGYFFDQWVYDAYYPVYHFNFENRGAELAFVLKQVQGAQGHRPVFEMPVELKLLYEGGGDTIIKVWNDEIYQVYTQAVSEAVSMIQVDPNSWILDEAFYHPEIPVKIEEDGIYQTGKPAVYPNPVSGLFTVDLQAPAGHYNFLLYDAHGKSVMNISSLDHGVNRFSSEQLPSGIYVYVIRSVSGLVYQSGKLLIK